MDINRCLYRVNVVDLFYEYVPWGLQNRVNDILYGGIQMGYRNHVGFSLIICWQMSENVEINAVRYYSNVIVNLVTRNGHHTLHTVDIKFFLMIAVMVIEVLWFHCIQILAIRKVPHPLFPDEAYHLTIDTLRNQPIKVFVHKPRFYLQVSIELETKCFKISCVFNKPMENFAESKRISVM